MQAPTHLQHKPIIAVNDYDEIDGIYSFQTDARALSFGQSPYDETQLSLKVFRHTGDRWSRQSEDLPVHRVLDLTILAIVSMLGNPGNQPRTSIGEEVIEPSRINEVINYYNVNQAIIRPKLEEIRDMLNRLL